MDASHSNNELLKFATKKFATEIIQFFHNVYFAVHVPHRVFELYNPPAIDLIGNSFKVPQFHVLNFVILIKSLCFSILFLKIIQVVLN